MTTKYALAPNYRCPECGSSKPHLHPAVQHEGEVQVCRNEYHLIATNQNTPKHIQAVLAARAALTGAA